MNKGQLRAFAGAVAGYGIGVFHTGFFQNGPDALVTCGLGLLVGGLAVVVETLANKAGD